MDSELPWKPPVSRERPSPPRDDSRDALSGIFREIQYNYDRNPSLGDYEDVVARPHGVAVGPGLPRRGREEVHRKLCSALGVQSAPVRFGIFLGWGIPTRGKFLDMTTRYRETVHRCNADPRLALVERREPTYSGKSGKLYTAFVVIVVESSAFPNGRPSQSLRDWLKAQGPMMRPRD
jgi:hypothetical protein